MKCWHCGNKARYVQDAYIKFSFGEEWIEKKVWICNYCYHNLRRGVKRKKS